jgi:hypothetical protein
MPSCREIRVAGRQRADAMQGIWQNDDGLDSERSTFSRRHENIAKIVNAFGQEFSMAFQQGDSEKERAARNNSANVSRHDFSLTQNSKAGCASLSRPTANTFSGKTQGEIHPTWLMILSGMALFPRDRRAPAETRPQWRQRCETVPRPRRRASSPGA